MSGAPSQRVRNVICQLVLVRISHYQADAGQRRNLFRRPLRVTAGDQDSRTGVFPMNAADGSTCVLISRRGDGAGIQDDDFSLDGSAGALQSAGQQLALNGGAIGLGRAASEVLHMIRRHESIILGWLFEAGGASEPAGSRRWAHKKNHNSILCNLAAGIRITPAAYRDEDFPLEFSQ